MTLAPNFTLAPATRVPGGPSPAADMDGALNALLASGAALNVMSTAFGTADPLGGIDSTAAIQAALNAASSGQVVVLPAGSFKVSSTLTVPTGVTLAGQHGSQGTPYAGSTLVLASPFTGTPVLTFSNNSSEQTIRDLNIDATALSAGSVVGISASGLTVTGLTLDRLFIYGAGLNQGVIGGGKGWWLDRVTVNASNGTCFSFGSTSDCTWLRCHAIGGGATGFFIANCANGKMIGCKAEFCTVGFNIASSWTTGNGAGGFQMIGCSTDRNVNDGTLINGTGTAPILISGHMARRDGSNAGSWGGITCNGSTLPVTITGLSTYVGVNDDGSGTNGPKYGFQIINSCSNVNLHSGVLMGATAALNDDTTNSNWYRGPFVISAHGTTASLTWDDNNFLAAQRITSNGLAGSTAASRYVGATTSGAPGSGTYNTGDFVIDRTGLVWVCTAGGSPGTWVQAGNPMTTTGDLIRGGASGAATRLAVGSAGQLLGVAGGIPAWSANVSRTRLDTEPGTVACRMLRTAVGSAAIAALNTTGQVAAASVALVAGQVVSNIIVWTGSTPANGPTHFWAGLADSTVTVQAVSSDKGSAAIAANTFFTFAVGPYTVTATGPYYILVSSSASTTAPTMSGIVLAAGANSANPVMCGTAGTQAAPPSLAAQLNAGVVNGNGNMNFAAWIS